MKLDINKAARIALCCAILALSAPIAIPVGAVPITLATLVIYITAPLLGAGGALVFVILYIALGALGLPVFSGMSAGVGVLLSPLGGYIWGYIPLALICGFAVSRGGALLLIAMITGTVVLYILGTAYYCYMTDCGVLWAVGVCVLPFLLGDCIKIAVAYKINEKMKRFLS